MEGSSRNLSTADDLDSTVLRHQVHRYYSELQQDALLTDTPLNMDFLGMKRRPGTASSTANKNFNPDGLPKRMRFDATDQSITGEFSGIISSRKPVHDSLSSSRMDFASATVERKVNEKQAQIINLQQKVLELETRLSKAETQKDHLKQTTKDAEERWAMLSKQLMHWIGCLPRRAVVSGFRTPAQSQSLQGLTQT